MRKFLFGVSLFTASIIVLITILVLSSAYTARQTFDFEISQEKNILLVGNSHPEHAIDDSALSNVFNLAQSGTGYFYDYLKVREITQRNSHIDTVVIGYSYEDMHKHMDSWFTGANRIKHKFKNFFFLFNTDDYLSILKSNPLEVLRHTPQTIFQNVLRPVIGYKGLGGYQKIDLNKLEKAKELRNEFVRDINHGYSKYQTEYLLKIYNYCNARDITLVLLNTPINSTLREIHAPLIPLYCNFAKNSLPKAILTNHANFSIPDEGFRDLDHLNKVGSKIYTNFLKSNKFRTGQKICP